MDLDKATRIIGKYVEALATTEQQLISTRVDLEMAQEENQRLRDKIPPEVAEPGQ